VFSQIVEGMTASQGGFPFQSYPGAVAAA
jgi:hypothetical protein